MIDFKSILSNDRLIHFSGYEMEKLSSGDEIAGFTYEQVELVQNQPFGAIQYILATGSVSLGLKQYEAQIKNEISDILFVYPTALDDILNDKSKIGLLDKIRNYRVSQSSTLIISTNFSQFELYRNQILTNKSLIDHAINNPKFFEQINYRDFEFFMAELLQKLGYKNIEITPIGKDSGVDIFANIEHKLGNELMIVQCKKYAAHHKVGEPIVKQLLCDTGLQKASKGLIATTSVLTKPAQSLVSSYSHKLISMDINDIRKQISNYQNFLI